MSDLGVLQKRAAEIRQKYAELNQKNGTDEWGSMAYMIGFVGDVGDLTKLVMAKENLRHIDELDSKLAHELSDCLWSVLVLADHYGVDLDAAFNGTMDELEQRMAA